MRISAPVEFSASFSATAVIVGPLEVRGGLAPAQSNQ